MSDGSTGASSLVSYSTSAPAIATVSSKGVVTGLAAGVATISGQVGELHDELVVTVQWPAITSVAFGRDTATLLLDDSLSAVAVVKNAHDKAAPNAVVTYSSSAPSVATVDVTGRIRTFATGSATITATVESLHADLQVTVVPHFTQIATGQVHTCGIAGTGRVYCWGSNVNATLAVGNTPDCTPQNDSYCVVPVPVTGTVRFVSLTAGAFHTCGLTSAGTAYCWGGNDTGQLGIGTLGGKATVPTPVTGGLTFTSIHAGRTHTCGTVTSGDAYCWGHDDKAQLGAGTTAAGRCYSNEPCSGTPLKVAGNFSFTEVYGSDRASCGRDASGAILCWGMEVGGTDMTDCQGGLNSTCTRTPLLQVGGATFPALGMGDVYRCGQKSDGVIWCWGVDYWGGNFGNGQPAAPTDTLVRAAGGKSYTQAAFGRTHVCGLDSGSVECWGNGYSGQVGGAIGVDRTTPGPVSGGISFSSITSSADADNNCGISTAGRAYCWGNGQSGQLGDGTLASSAQPVLVKLVR